jgi:hypothetical protein
MAKVRFGELAVRLQSLEQGIPSISDGQDLGLALIMPARWQQTGSEPELKGECNGWCLIGVVVSQGLDQSAIRTRKS